MISILDIVAPVFGIVGLGWLATRVGLFKDDWIDGLAGFVFRFAIPMLLFSSMVTSDIARVFNKDLLIGYFGAGFATYALTALVVGRLFARPGRDVVVIGMAGMFSNVVLIGIPLTQMAFGLETGAIIFGMIAVHSPLLLTVVAILMAIVDGREGCQSFIGVLWNTVRDALANPIILSIFAGIAWNLAGLPFGGVATDIVSQFAMVAGPCALFSAGASLTRFEIVRAMPEALIVAVMKLAVFPALTALMTLVILPVPFVAAKVAIMMAALPAGVNVYLIANHYKAAEGANTSAMLISTILSVVTVSVVLLALEAVQ